jgi:hypothetical protein
MFSYIILICSYTLHLEAKFLLLKEQRSILEWKW